jgi:hypothetical protein
MKCFVALLMAALVFVSAAGAVVLIELPELVGDYSISDSPPLESPWTRSTTFALPDSIETIEGLRFVVSGSWTSGLIETCRTIGESTYCDTLPLYTNLTLRLTAESLGACHFQATTSTFNGVNGNELLVEFCPDGQSDINLLLGSVISAELYCDLDPEVILRIVETTSGTLTGIRLETVGAVQGGESTWGAVKSLYR